MTTSIDYRTLDHLQSLLRVVKGSQSTIDSTLYGDTPNLPDIYYVDSGIGADGNDGRDPAAPMATIDAAIGRCTASQGDVILVQPGHAETLSALITLDVIGVSIIGVGEGTLRPQLTINAAIDGISITAANCLVENIGFPVSTAGATSQINVAAADATIKGCHFAEGASDLLGTITVTADGEVCTIKDCTVIVTADGPDEWILVEGVVDRLTIRNNHVVGSDGTNAVDLGIINCAAVAVTNLLVTGNDFSGGGVATNSVVGTALVAPIIEDNRYSGLATQGAQSPRTFYVDSGTGSDSHAGTDPAFPMATIDAAVGRTTTSVGDTILVQPGHAETLAALITMDTIGTKLIGVGEGTLRPQLTINAVIDGISITANNCRVENIGFAVSTAGATSQINVAAANATLKGVHFAEGASDILGTITVTADGEVCTIEDCTVVVTADGPDEWILVEGVVDRLVIRRNIVACGGTTIGFDEAIIQCDAVAVTNLVVVDNTFLGQDATAAIDAVSGSALVGPAIGPNIYRGGVVQGSPEWVEGLGYRITKSGARPSGAGADDLFDINGLVKVTALFGEVTTQIDANSDLILNMKAAGGAALNTITVLDGDVVQTMYSPAAAGAALNVSGVNQAFLTATPMVMNTDTLEATWTEAGTTGAILWTLYYIPLETGATVEAST